MDSNRTPEKFGTVLGVAPGEVEIFSSDYKSADDAEFPDRQSYRSFLDGVYMGQKWQCVEFARRWLYINYGYVFDDIPMAYDIFKLNAVRVIADNSNLPLYSFLNGSKRRPVVGCMLIWDEGGTFSTTGHVAIVTEVTDTCVRFVEQNVGHSKWSAQQTFSREIAASVAADGGFSVACTFEDGTILGWVIQTDNPTLAETFDEIDKKAFNLKSRVIPHSEKFNQPWLDETQKDQAAYVKMMGGHTLATDAKERGRYFRMSETALVEIKRATNELHALFMHATEHVLQNEALFEKFAIAKSLLPKIRQSWSNRRNEMITGRFDFALSEDGLKVYEYNCDSASCHMESGKIQRLWAEHLDCKDGFDAGRSLEQRLINAWKKTSVDGLVHIMHDLDLEETYHALYMQQIIEAAGLPTKRIRGITGLSWDPEGNILDADGERIRWVWKTWAWETALDQLRDELEDGANPSLERKHSSEVHPSPRLVDVLLRNDVMVFEPLWTLIPSNKAILPVLWRLIPNHPNLLKSAFELRDALLESGYAVKPIVGRGGCNISIVDIDSTIVAATGGTFDERDLVYQEIWRLPQVSEFYVQVSSFSAGGSYGGAGVRADKSVVINKNSDCFPLRIVPDAELTRD